MPLESYLRTLWAFLQAVRHGAVGTIPHGEDDPSVAYLRLSISGFWEVTTPSPDTPAATTSNDITIPLVLPLVPIILVAHVETQWTRSQSEAGAASLLPR